MKSLLSVIVTMVMLSSAGCERKTVVIEVPAATPVAEPVAKTKTFETARLGEAVDAFEKNPTAQNSADAKKALAKLDVEIAKLEEYIAKHDGDERAKAEGKLTNMREYRAAETARLAAAQAKSPLISAEPVDTRSGADKIGDSARKAGHSIGDAVRDAGDTIKDAIHKQ